MGCHSIFLSIWLPFRKLWKRSSHEFLLAFHTWWNFPSANFHSKNYIINKRGRKGASMDI